MKILVINCGSSSLKYQLIDMENESVVAKGLCERIGIDGSKLTHQPAGKDKFVIEKPMPTHKTAIQMVMEALLDAEHGVIKDTSEISAIGHRVLHGGTVYSDSIVVNDDVKRVIRECFDLGPLHNPANLMGIEACEAAMPGTPNVAVFDTAFGMSMPEKAYMYAIPHKYFEKYGIRRYGFHGTSHKFVSGEAIKFGGLDPETAKVIVCLQFIMNKEGIDINEMLDILNKKSGVYGMTNGISSDFRDIENAKADGNHLAEVALDAFIYRVTKYIGAYAAAMNGVDAIAFTAGVGENDKTGRKAICSNLAYMGVKIDDEANNVRGQERMISAADSKVKVMLIPTNEELAIARETLELVQ